MSVQMYFHFVYHKNGGDRERRCGMGKKKKRCSLTILLYIKSCIVIILVLLSTFLFMSRVYSAFLLLDVEYLFPIK